MKYTQQQIDLLRDSWESMKEMGMQELGLLIFHRLLNESTFIRHMFYNIEISPDEDLPLEKMRQKRKVKSHATSIAVSITKYVEYLDRPEELNKLVQDLGEIHHRKRVDPEYFEYLFPVLLYVIQERLGLSSGSDTVQAWIKCFSTLRNEITNKMRQIANSID